MNNIFKKIGIGTVATLLGLIVFAGTSFAAPSYSLFDDATLVAGGNPGNAIQLRSNVSPGVIDGGIDFTGTGVTTFSSISKLSTDYKFTAASCGGGAPRFQINIDGKNANVYIGPPPNYTGCPANVWANTGNLVGPASFVDTSQLPGGTFYDTFASADTKYGTHAVTGIQLVTDASWFFKGTQTVLVDNVMINSNTYTFDPVLVGPPTKQSQCEDGGWKTFNNPTFTSQEKCEEYVESHHKVTEAHAKLTHVGLNPAACTGPFTGKSGGNVEVQTSNKNGAFTVDIDVHGAKHNATYDVDVRCVGKIGTLKTDDEGNGEAHIKQSTTPTSPFYIDISIPGGGGGAGGYGDTFISGPFTLN